ncbi:MAG: PDZ domain-containing protein, partial [gamma proteobacterium symbiont of Bathyaustriella thionipta]|nr:PDZ domain-containing protein [gamma proteobacterium symbiont of Bathyaustriella thionipta]
KKTLIIKTIIGGDKVISSSSATQNQIQGFNRQHLHPALEGARFAQNHKNQGVQVLNVTQASPAWQSGLRENDYIIAVNRQSINSINDLKKLAQKKTNKTIALNIQRGNSALFLVLR